MSQKYQIWKIRSIFSSLKKCPLLCYVLQLSSQNICVPLFILHFQPTSQIIVFQDIMIESDIVAAGSVNGVLSGKHYNRSIRAHKLIYEAMQRLRVKAFLKSLPENDDRRCDFSLVGVALLGSVDSISFLALLFLCCSIMSLKSIWYN